ncbi:transglycosylase family protein [Streptomyces sp. NPDC059861]|uniref:transglycosylase family protein n=1 Tax=Streptomyces sp. NPDC059861 TaxID=3346974 RepID=UPI00364B7372
MLSGNGRHRRPRQAPALVVAAGVTGSAIAIPLLAASGASAASGTTWDRVAECETGGSWSADTGNGYYGGLQLSQQDWEKHGGLTYAASADQASRSQQIAVAEKVLADQGVGAWATCGPLVGLDVDSESAAVDTGVVGDASSTPSHTRSSDSGSMSRSLGLSNSSGGAHAGDSGRDGDANGSSSSKGTDGSKGSGASTGSTSPTNSGNPTESGESTPSGDSSSPGVGDSTSPGSSESPESGESSSSSPSSGVPSSAPSTSSLTDVGLLGSGKHRGSSAEEGGDRAGGSAGRHASRDGATARAAGDEAYTVRDGDTLWSIADSHGVQGGWAALYVVNKEALGGDPHHIFPGQTLDVGAEPAGR